MAFYQLFHLILQEIDRFGCFMLKSGFFSTARAVTGGSGANGLSLKLYFQTKGLNRYKFFKRAFRFGYTNNLCVITEVNWKSGLQVRKN